MSPKLSRLGKADKRREDDLAHLYHSVDEVDSPVNSSELSLLVNRSSTMYTNNKTLRFTRNTGQRLTPDQRIFYEENGYLVVPRLVPQNILEKCSSRFDDIATKKVKRGMMTVMHDVVDRKSVNKIQDIVHDEVFCEYIEYKPLLDIVECFTGPSIMAMHTMLIAKPPDIGSKSSRHPPHQDMYYFPFGPADRIVAAWTAIEPCDTLNGCLYVSPGSHLAGQLYSHGYPQKLDGPVNKLYHQIQDLPDSLVWVHLEAEPGDTLFFHPLLIHGSGVNRSKRTRKVISCHYAAADCKYTEVRGTVQEPIRNEAMEIMRKRLPGLDVDFTDYWRLRSKLVRGIRSSL
ncbi:probable phytanoyl-CoA dioxygenase isoform X2 [Venturia canescens]|uniref:probable phytanoyl-CoA dioxygenase isoform X2 n=1 Tax=Venturia canescens TaxID=32260 RepID=UPI001C9D31B5|nr:probable phytanoyl-CoA dioxygenase isoform X2 [Venturia canescens]